MEQSRAFHSLNFRIQKIQVWTLSWGSRTPHERQTDRQVPALTFTFMFYSLREEQPPTF